jgi:microcystin-dependent protein
MIRALPPAPSRDDPANFSPRGDALLGALDGFVDDCNALDQSLQLVATTATSASTFTIGAGSITFGAQSSMAGKAWATGAFLYAVSAATVANLMVGQITAYNATTGALTLNVVRVQGAGTFSAWVLGLAPIDTGNAPIESPVFTGSVVLPALTTSIGDGTEFTGVTIKSGRAGGVLHSEYLDARHAGGVAHSSIQFVGNVDGSSTVNIYATPAGSTSSDRRANRLFVNGTDGPARGDDATTANGLVRKSQMDRGWQVGDLKEATGTTAGSDWAAPVGQELVRASYPELWTFAQASGNIDTDAAWAAGKWGGYSTGNGTTTFRLPDLRAENRSMPDLGRGIDTTLVAGTKYDQSIQSHNHTVVAAIHGPGSNAYPGGGAFSGGSTIQSSYSGGSWTRQRGVSIPLYLKIR